MPESRLLRVETDAADDYRPQEAVVREFVREWLGSFEEIDPAIVADHAPARYERAVEEAIELHEIDAEFGDSE
jgi:hypothetical protein